MPTTPQSVMPCCAITSLRLRSTLLQSDAMQLRHDCRLLHTVIFARAPMDLPPAELRQQIRACQLDGCGDDMRCSQMMLDVAGTLQLPPMFSDELSLLFDAPARCRRQAAA